MTTGWEQRSLVEDILARGVDDWVDVGQVVQVAKREAISSDGPDILALGLVSTVLFRRLMIAGDVVKGKFQAWDVPPEAAFSRIAEHWFRAEVDNRLLPGDIGWMCNTAEGDIIGRAVLERESEDG